MYDKLDEGSRRYAPPFSLDTQKTARVVKMTPHTRAKVKSLTGVVDKEWGTRYKDDSGLMKKQVEEIEKLAMEHSIYDYRLSTQGFMGFASTLYKLYVYLTASNTMI